MVLILHGYDIRKDSGYSGSVPPFTVILPAAAGFTGLLSVFM